MEFFNNAATKYQLMNSNRPIMSRTRCKGFFLSLLLEYNKDLDSDIRKETSGDFQDLLLQHLSGKAGKGDGVDKDKAEKDARALHDVCA